MRTLLVAGASLLVQVVVVWGLLSWLGIALIRAMPGDPLEYFATTDANATAADIERVRHALGLDQSVTAQWWRLWSSPQTIMSRTHEPVWQVIFSSTTGGWSRWGWSLLLTVPPFVLSILMSLLGVWFARHPSGRAMRWAMSITNMLMTIPMAMLALLLSWLVVVSGLPLPMGASTIGHGGVVDVIGHAILPWLVCLLTYVPTLLRMTMVQGQAAWQSAHVVAARAMGASEQQLAWQAVAPMVMGALCSLVAAWLPVVVGGAVLVENVFAWPGLGRLQLEAVQRRDVWLAVVIMLVLCTVALVGTRVLDMVRSWIDPRVSRR
jgi:peptide/nickel transport system permease protein